MYNQLKALNVQVKINVPLAKYTTFRIGGPAQYFVIPKTVDEFVKVLKLCDDNGANYFILSGGSNVLIRDEGFDGVVIHPEFKTIEINGELVSADAGALTAQAAQKATAAGLAGLEWAVGVPGLIGGAVRGNAGCLGSEIKDVLYYALVYKDGEVCKLNNAECAFNYRDSIFKHGGGVVLSAVFKLKKGNAQEGAKKIIENIQYRSKTQPKIASSGCIFKNPVKDGKLVSAGALIEQAGCKGMRLGGAEVSKEHGNFIINTSGATAQDVLQLIEFVKNKVMDKFGVALEEEIQVV